MKIGDEVYIHGYVDEIRQNVVIIRNDGGYFGTVAEEITSRSENPNTCGDAISRQMAIDALKDIKDLQGQNLFEKRGLFPWNIIAQLPSVTPQPKIGHSFPEGTTNKDIFKAIFGYEPATDSVVCNKEDWCGASEPCKYCTINSNNIGREEAWWNAEYKESSIRKMLIDQIANEKKQEPKWIPVSERLPKIAGVYRVTRFYPNNVMNPQYLVDACFFDGSNTWHNDNRINHERAYADNVIAWQEDPEPYKAESEDKE